MENHPYSLNLIYLIYYCQCTFVCFVASIQINYVHINTCWSYAAASYLAIPTTFCSFCFIQELSPPIKYIYVRFREHVNISNLPGIVDAVAVWCEYIRYLEAVCIARIDCNIGRICTTVGIDYAYRVLTCIERTYYWLVAVAVRPSVHVRLGAAYCRYQYLAVVVALARRIYTATSAVSSAGSTT